MTKFMILVVASLLVMSVSSLSFAGMFDKAVEATEQANTMAKDAKEKADSAEQKTIEAEDASKQQTGSMLDQAKEAAKETVNEKIDSIGK
jgi:F0F1-type ATP synthase membrane subunit b/b'